MTVSTDYIMMGLVGNSVNYSYEMKAPSVYVIVYAYARRNKCLQVVSSPLKRFTRSLQII